ncbi:MAG: ZIP family metal transporter [Microgenomates group bacterium]
MNLLANIIIFTFLGGVVSLIGGIALLFWRKVLTRFIMELTSFAAGVMITVSILDLLPESILGADVETASVLLLVGVLFLFFLERTSLWFHHHHEPHGHGPSMVGVWLGDTLHNMIDGVAIGAAFLLEPAFGKATALAVAAHELPQEMADFTLYVKAGFSRTKTITLNVLSSLATIAGGVGVYLLGNFVEGIEPYILAFTAGMFLYIALADLIPELHRTTEKRETIRQLASFSLGIFVAYLSIKLLGA